MDGCVGIDDHYRAKYGQLHSGKGKVFLGGGREGLVNDKGWWVNWVLVGWWVADKGWWAGC